MKKFQEPFQSNLLTSMVNSAKMKYENMKPLSVEMACLMSLQNKIQAVCSGYFSLKLTATMQNWLLYYRVSTKHRVCN